jgi:hypothetical protein
MTRSEFVFIMILLIVFIKFNAGYKKKHNDKSILDETKVKKTLHTFSLLDIISRLGEDILVAG